MTTERMDPSNAGGVLLLLPTQAPGGPATGRHGSRADRSPSGRSERRSAALPHELGDLLDSVTDLLAQHLRLAHLELQDDARWIGKRVVLILALTPLVLVGFSFLCATAAFELAQLSSWPVALAVIGALNLLVGLAGIGIAAKQIGKRQILAQTIVELEPSSSGVPLWQGAPA